MAEGKSSPNWLLQGFILISLVIHLFIFLHIAGIYENNAFSYIELSMQQISSPNLRAIPKPRVRKAPPKVSEVKTLQVNAVNTPRIKVDLVSKPEPVHTHDRIDLPELPDGMDIAGLKVAGLTLQDPAPNVQAHEAEIEFTTAKEYFEMLNLRIHSFKKYPDSAKSRHLEGRVKLEFVLLKDGTLTDLKIVKSSRHKNLDEAAFDAINRAAPFPRPPAFLFTPPIKMKISLLFELA